MSNGLWSSPDILDSGTAATELGVKFFSDVAGTISGIRFYKGPKTTGTHIGSLWASGNLLGRTTFSNESAGGWQTAMFSTPIPIAANQTYVACYYTAVGHYATTVSQFNNQLDATPLHIPVGGGVYVHGKGLYPTTVYKNSNYWVDVIFTPTPIPPPPVDCVLSDWGAWSAWTVAADGLSQTRTRSRTIVTTPANGGMACGTLTDSETQAITPPPVVSVDGTYVPPANQIVDNSLAVWMFGTAVDATNFYIMRNGVSAGGGYGSKLLWYNGCVYTLGGDLRWYQATMNGDSVVWVGLTTVDPSKTPVNCVLSDWGVWSDWVTSADGLTKTRTRTRTIVTQPANGGMPCGSTTDSETQLTNPTANWFDQNMKDPIIRSCGSTFFQDGLIDRMDMVNLFGKLIANGVITADQMSDLTLIVGNASLFGGLDHVQQLATYIVTNVNPASNNYQGQPLGCLKVGSTPDQLQKLVAKFFYGADHPAAATGYSPVSGPLFMNN